MSESKILFQLAEQWRLVRSAPIPYLAGLILVAVFIFFGLQWWYQQVIELKDVEINTLDRRLKAVTDERDDLKKVAEKSQNPKLTVPAPRDPDGLYQLNKQVAKASGGVVDRAGGTVSFPVIQGDSDLNMRAPMEFREFSIASCMSSGGSVNKSAGLIIRQSWVQVKCEIIGLHP